MLMIVVSKSTKISKNHHLRNVFYSHQDQEHENSHNQQKHGSNNNQAIGDLICQCERDRGGVLNSCGAATRFPWIEKIKNWTRNWSEEIEDELFDQITRWPIRSGRGGIPAPRWRRRRSNDWLWWLWSLIGRMGGWSSVGVLITGDNGDRRISRLPGETSHPHNSPCGQLIWTFETLARGSIEVVGCCWDNWSAMSTLKRESPQTCHYKCFICMPYCQL